LLLQNCTPSPNNNQLTMTQFSPQPSVTILSWNTLCAQDPWYEGWGCPLEQERRDALMELKDISMEQAQAFLTRERYHRIRKALQWEMLLGINDEDDDSGVDNTSMGDSPPLKPADIWLFQELTRDHPWDDPPEEEEDDEFATLLSTMYERVPCQDDSDYKTTQRVYVRRDSGWKVRRSFGLQTDVLEGGCVLELQYVGHDHNDDDDNNSKMIGNQVTVAENFEDESSGTVAPSTFNDTSIYRCKNEMDDLYMDGCDTDKSIHNKLYVVNLHGKSSNMRHPEQLRAGTAALWKEISHLLRPPTGNEEYWDDPDAYGDSWKERIVLCGDWNVHLADLPQSLAEPGTYSHIQAALLDNHTSTNFSTNHEDGFLAQYDGCLLAKSPLLGLQSVSRNLTGFMAKGEHEELMGDFSYQLNQGLSYGGTLLPGTKASEGLSDHLRVYTKFSVSVKDEIG
jgi:hypothetical protein